MHPARFRHEQAIACRRARARLDFGNGDMETGEINVMPHYDSRGRKLGYDVFLVDTTHPSRSREAGMPEPMNDVPIPYFLEAQEYAQQVLRGRRIFSWGGVRAHPIDPAPQDQPQVFVSLTDVAPPWLKGSADAR